MLKIYLADLIYDTIRTNYVVPLNVAYIAAYTAKKYRGEVDITIFKYPKHLEEAIRNEPPDVLGLSHYNWNARIDILFVEMAKQLNANTITIMGGPHIRTDPDGIRSYLTENPYLDYYILHEGEEPFSGIVGAIMEGRVGEEQSLGYARIADGEFIFKPAPFNKKSQIIDLPSPYLSGFLDPFLADPQMIPLFETNRGCPFGCIYCAWGIAALSRVRQRDIDVVYEEIDYVAEKSAGQVNWIFCDANFGILPRDLDIARKVRSVIDRKGYPVNVTLWHSKNTSRRNVEIVKAVGARIGNVAIQSADPVVLENCGRGNIKTDELMKHIAYYRDNYLEVATDILIGLPGENAESHLKTLHGAFDIGFDQIHPYNIRMLPGSKYETPEYRQKYEVRTKFRPIFGAYGIYDNKKVLELEESVRATKDMSEEELDNFKVLHWLIYFAWNCGVFKPILRFGQQYGINPCSVLHRLSFSENPSLTKTFQAMKQSSIEEWFDREEDIISFYEREDNFDELTNNFTKLNFLYISIVYREAEVISALEDELIKILLEELEKLDQSYQVTIEALKDFTNKFVCKDLLQKEYSIRKKYQGRIVSIALNYPRLSKQTDTEVEFYRDTPMIKFCDYHLKRGGARDYSLKNLSRFFEIGGTTMLVNKVRVLQS